MDRGDDARCVYVAEFSLGDCTTYRFRERLAPRVVSHLRGLKGWAQQAWTTTQLPLAVRFVAILCITVLTTFFVSYVFPDNEVPAASFRQPTPTRDAAAYPAAAPTRVVPPVGENRGAEPNENVVQNQLPRQGNDVKSAPSPSAAKSDGQQTKPPTQAAVLVMQGRYYQRNGDYDKATESFRTVIFAYPGTPDAADAYLGLAETYNLNGQFKAAIEELQEFLKLFSNDPRVNRVLFSIGNNYKALKEWGGAIYYYSYYAERSDLLRGYAYLEMGDSYFQATDFSHAIENLKLAVDAGLPRVPTVTAMEQVADSYFRLADYRSAIEWYRRALELASSASFKADITNRVGKAYAALGDIQQAKGAWEVVIEHYPGTEYALNAVESLPPNSNPPTHFHQGLVYYNNKKFDAAIAAFNEYLVRYPAGDDVPRTYYYLALSYRQKDDFAEAIARFDEVIKIYPGDNVAGDALWQAGLLAESLSRHDEAIQRFGRVAVEYPNSQFAQDAIFHKGLCQYKVADYAGAQATWQMLATDRASKYASRGRFWMAKAMGRRGDGEGVRRQLAAAAAEGTDYYAVRAKTLTTGRAFDRAAASDWAIRNDVPEEILDFERWLASWSEHPSYSYDGNDLSLRADTAFRRAEELVRVGSWNAAQDEFVELRQKYAKDPVALYELAMFLRNNGMFYPSISVAMDIASLSPLRGLQGTPKFLQKLAYPMPFSELLLAESRRYGFDPLLLASLIRQESYFDRKAESSAGAKGLAQVMPSTGQGIARALGMASFVEDDLFKPYVSVAFGAWYLRSQLDSYSGDVFPSLAAYNAGGGNVGKWLGDKWDGDDDLFVEEIDFVETQTYVKSVYRQYQTYREIYGN